MTARFPQSGWIKPAPDRRVRHPGGALLDEAGEEVEPSSYWLRRLGDGDVVEAAPITEKKGR